MASTRSTGNRLVLGGALALAVAVALAGWRAVYGRRWEGVEEGFRRPIAVLAIAVTSTALLVAIRAARGRSGGLIFGALAVLVSATASADVVQRAARHGAPVVDVLLPLVALVASVAVLTGAVLERRQASGGRHDVPAHPTQQLDDVRRRLLG